MMGLVNIPYHLVATANTSGYEGVWRVPAGKIFKVERLQIAFAAGTNRLLHIALYDGIRKVSPQVRDYTGEDVLIDICVDIKFFSDSTVSVWYNNEDTANDHECNVILSGKLV